MARNLRTKRPLGVLSSFFELYEGSLVQMEADFHTHVAGHGIAVAHARLKLPRAHGLDGLFVETQAEGFHNADVAYVSVGADDDPEDDGP